MQQKTMEKIEKLILNDLIEERSKDYVFDIMTERNRKYLTDEEFLKKDMFDRIRYVVECEYPNLTIAELERKAGIANGSVRRWGKKTMPAADKLYKVSEFLGVDINIFLLGSFNSTDREDNTDNDII